MKLSKELNKKEKEIYIKICTRIWGCVPVDVLWAMESKPYKNQIISEFSNVTIRMHDSHIQTRVYITEEEFQKDIQLEKVSSKKYKRKYDMYNCIVENCPVLYNNKNIMVGDVFNYKIPYNGGADCRVEILNIEKKHETVI